jgi:hypothetical protein
MTALGTVGAVLVALFWPTVLAHYRRPRLAIIYAPGPPCDRYTPMQDSATGTWVDSRWVRVEVENVGRSTARGCKGKLAAVFTPEGKPRGDRDPMLLRWSLAGASEERQLDPLDLAPEDSDFLAIVYATNARTDAAFIATDPKARPGFDMTLEADVVREHRVTLAVYADNAEVVQKDFVITYAGTIDRLRMRLAVGQMAENTSWVGLFPIHLP